jgi:hypothetical protein
MQRVKDSYKKKGCNNMFKKRYILGLVGIGVVAISMMLIAAVPKQVNSGKYCYSMLSPVAANSNESSKILESGCFDSFAELIQAATGGRVNLDSSIQPKDLTNEMLNSEDSS